MKYCIFCKNDDFSLEIKDKLFKSIKLEYSEETPDIVVVVGGDGTLINASHKHPKAIIFGLHTGHLGFYANYTVADIEVMIDDINNGNYQIDEIDALCCEVRSDSDDILSFALNEMTIIMPPHTLILDVFIDDEKLETFRGTGLCISTAYGSTAYNKSLHGAVVDPAIKTIQITEIAGLNSNAYRTLSSSFVLAKERVITLKSIDNVDVYVTIDNLSYNLHNFKSAKITLKEKSLKLGYHNKTSHLERIKRTFLCE